MATSVDADRILVSKSGTPIAGRTDGVGVLPDAAGVTTATDGLVAISNGSVSKCLDHSMLCEVFEDFLGPTIIPTVGANDLAQGPWIIKDTSAAGSPTKVIVADADNGQLALAFDNQAEEQILTLYWGDEQNIDSDQEPVCIWRLSVDADFTTATTVLVWGFASAQNDTEDTVAQNAWFRLDGDLALDVESDDNSTNSDDKSTGITLTAATMYEFMVSCSAVHGASVTNIKFFYRATLGGDWTDITPAGTTFKMAADTAIQPYLQIHKAANADTDGCKIDYVRVWWKRN